MASKIMTRAPEKYFRLRICAPRVATSYHDAWRQGTRPPLTKSLPEISIFVAEEDERWLNLTVDDTHMIPEMNYGMENSFHIARDYHLQGGGGGFM